MSTRYLFHPSSPDEELCSCQGTSQGLGECVPVGDRVRYARSNQKQIILSLTIDVTHAKNPFSIIPSPLYFIGDRQLHLSEGGSKQIGLNDLNINTLKLNLRHSYLCIFELKSNL